MKLKLISNKINHRKPSVKRHEEKMGKFIFVLLGTGAFICGIAVALYMFQDKIPHLRMDPPGLIIPITQNHENIDFAKAFKDNGIVFESLMYASESPTLVVRLPDNVYAYFNSNQDPVPAIKILKDILSRVAIEQKGKKLKYVDLRLENAVVKF